MNKCLALSALLLLSLSISLAQTTPNVITLDWNTWETNRNEVEQQKTLVYVYTDWCALCKKMENEAFANSSIQTLVTDQFKLVGLNAETKTALNFQGQSYEYVRRDKLGYHELAAHLLDGRLAFPSLVFMDEKGQIIQAIHGYQGPQHLEMLLRYYGENHYRSTPWISFQRHYGSRQLTDDE